MSGLILKNISKIYPGGQQAVRDFSLEVKNHEFLILAGPTGCGKSTLLRMIAGLEEISSGALFIDGVDMTDAEPKDRNVAMVFKNSVLYPEMTVLDNLSFALRMGRMTQTEMDARIGESARLLNLENILDKMPKELTREETYRVLLGRALVRRPGILLLDSPIADLEESLQAVMRREFYNVYKNMEMTVIYVTDNQETAMTLGTRMVIMNDGTISQEGAPADLEACPANCFVGGVAGRFPMSLFPVSVVEEGGHVVLKGKSGQVILPEKTGSELARKMYLGKEVMMGIRSDALHLEKNGKKGGNGMFYVKILGTESNGRAHMLRFQVEESEGVCRIETGMEFEPGEMALLSMDADKVYLFDKGTEKNIFA